MHEWCIGYMLLWIMNAGGNDDGVVASAIIVHASLMFLHPRMVPFHTMLEDVCGIRYVVIANCELEWTS